MRASGVTELGGSYGVEVAERQIQTTMKDRAGALQSKAGRLGQAQLAGGSGEKNFKHTWIVRCSIGCCQGFDLMLQS